MVTITPMANGKGQLSINVGMEKVRLDLTKTVALQMSDYDYALAKVSIAPWIGVKVTVEENSSEVQGEDTSVPPEVQGEANKASKKPTRKQRGLLRHARG